MRFISIIFILILLACKGPEIQKEISVIPRPNNVVVEKGHLKLPFKTSIYSGNSSLKRLSEFLSECTDIRIKHVDAIEKADILLLINKKLVGDEAYRLITTKKGIQITSATEKGIFYGLQTLKQLVLNAPIEKNCYWLPVLSIEDSPRFQWRGLMLDESRHFFGKEQIKELLDVMAYHKLNIFHWHLTDAPGWRIEISKYPRLTTIGGIGDHIDSSSPAKYYTQEEIREIVKYAGDRFIEIIPEIDMPGHASAANRAYPEFSGGGSPRYPDFTFNPGYEGTYTYLTDILKEVTGLFPFQYIHMGGDEVHFGNEQWKTNVHVRQLMKKENLNDLKEVESYFINRMADTLSKWNKIAVGWDEIVDHKLSKDKSLVMWWRHNMPGKLGTALEGGYNVVLCPRIPLYFDFVQDVSHTGGRKWAGDFSTLELTYQFPTDTLPGFTSHGSQVKGIQANVWTERIHNTKKLDFMIHPRLSAMSEAAWTLGKNKNLEDFKRRLPDMLEYLKKENVFFYDPFHPENTPEPVGPN